MHHALHVFFIKDLSFWHHGFHRGWEGGLLGSHGQTFDDERNVYLVSLGVDGRNGEVDGE